MRSGIAAAGNFIVNHLKTVFRYPAEGELSIITDQRWGTGGGAYDVLAALATLGVPFPLEAVGVVGDDTDGKLILDHLEALDVETLLMRTTKEARTSASDVITAASGTRTVFHDFGVNSLLCAEDIDPESLNARFLHLGSALLLKALDATDPADPARPCAASVFERAHAAGMITSLDMVYPLPFQVEEVIWPLLRHTDALVANGLECSAVSGIEMRDASGALQRERLSQIAARILELGVQRLVVIHVRDGALWRDSGGTELFAPALNVPRELIKSTNGAGDAFVAGILYGLHESWAPAECLRLAIATATCSLTDATCTGGLRSLDETLAFADQFQPQAV